jgi:hypothetical protein
MHRISGRIIRPFRPDIRYLAFGLADIRLAGYPAKTVSGASLVLANKFIPTMTALFHI